MKLHHTLCHTRLRATMRSNGSVIGSRRVLAATFFVLLSHDLFLWWTDDDLQGNANLICDREEFPAVSGPSDFVITSHRTNCGMVGFNSRTYVYLHRKSDPDRPANQVFRYDGDTPQPVWTGPAQVTIHVPHLSYIGKLVATLGGIHITGDYRYFPSTEPPRERSPDVGR